MASRGTTGDNKRKENNGPSQVDILFGICQVGQGREAPLEEPGMKEAAWMQHPLSAALGTDTRKVFVTGGQTEIALNVTLLIETDRPFHLFVTTKQNKTPNGKGRPDLGLHATLVLQWWYSRRHAAFSVFLPFLLFNLVKLSRATD